MSGRRSNPSREHILIDRCLSPRLAAPLGRLYQLRASTLAEVFGDDYSQKLPDIEWIEYCGREGVVGLTANPRIWKVPAEVEAIRRYSARIVAMKADTTLIESAMVLGQNLRVLREALSGQGPMFIQITSGRPLRRQFEPVR